MDYVKKFLHVEGVIGQGAFGKVLVTSPLQNQQHLQQSPKQQLTTNTTNLLQLTNNPQHTPANSEEQEEQQLLLQQLDSDQQKSNDNSNQFQDQTNDLNLVAQVVENSNSSKQPLKSCSPTFNISNNVALSTTIITTPANNNNISNNGENNINLSNSNTNTRFALKCVHPILRPPRLANELRHLRDLGGQANIVQMHTAHFNMGSLFIVMELIEHDRFVDIVADLEIHEIIMYMRNLLIALEFVHSHNIMHRDIKPANFLFNRKNKKFLLVDFGLAQTIRPRSVLFKTSATTNNTNNNNPNNNNSTTATTSVAAAESASTKISNQLPTTPTLNSTNSTNINRRHVTPQIDYNFHDKNNILGTPKKSHHINAPQLMMKSKSPFVNFKSTHIIQQSPAKHYINLTPTNSPITPNVSTKRQFDNGLSNANDFNSMLKKLRVSNGESRECNKLICGAYESPVTHGDNLNHRRNSMHPQTQNNHQHHQHKFSTPTVPIRRVPSAKCDCRGKARTCSICLSRPDSNAPKSGTPGYKAPEVLLRYPYQSTAVDIWSSGCIFACLLAGHSPFFRDVDDNTSLAEIITIFGSQKVSLAAKALGIRLTLEPKRDELDLKELCKSIRACPGKKSIDIPDSLYDLLIRMLDPDPNTRITASEALKHDCFNPMTEV